MPEVEELQQRFGELTVNAAAGCTVAITIVVGEHGLPHPAPSPPEPQASTPSGLAPSPPARQESTPLSMEERTLLNRKIGQWVTRALAGHRGECSGRAENPLSNRIWLVFKDFSGNEFDPVMVCKKWAQASDLVKQGRELSPNSVFIGLPSEGDAREVVAAAGKRWPS